MKLTVLLRYPKVENNFWKTELITSLSNLGYEVSVVFAECSYYSHFRSALKTYGFNFFSKKKNFDENHKKNVYKSIKNVVPTYNVSKHNSKSCISLLKKLEPNLIIMLGTGIISESVLLVPSIGTIHCHKGSLPKYKGLDTVKWSLLFDDELEITTHFVERSIDSGSIILSKKIDYSKSKSLSEIRFQCQQESRKLLIESVKKLNNNDEYIPKIEKGGLQYYQMHPFFDKLIELKRGILIK